MVAPESTIARVFKSKIFCVNCLQPKDDFDEVTFLFFFKKRLGHFWPKNIDYLAAYLS